LKPLKEEINLNDFQNNFKSKVLNSNLAYSASIPEVGKGPYGILTGLKQCVNLQKAERGIT
jgi:hypothetical protein